MSRRWFSVLTLGIVGTWVVLFSIHIYRHTYSGVEMSSLRTISADTFKVDDQWFSIYQEKNKIGHMHMKTEKIGDEYRFVQEVKMKAEQNGKIMDIKNELRCLSDSQFRIISFDFKSNSGETLFQSRGEYKDGMMVMFMEKDGEHRALNKEMSVRPYFPLTIKSALPGLGLKQGKKVRFPVLDFLNLNVIYGTAELKELIPLKLGGDVISISHVILDYSGNKDSFWISEAGYILREELAAGIVMLYEPQELATSPSEPGNFFDYIMVPTIPSNQIIDMPSKVKRMKVRISGTDLAEFPMLDGDYQNMDGDIVEITSLEEEEVKKNSYKIPYIGKDLEPYLEPTPWVQSREPIIEEFVKAVRGSMTDAAKVSGAFIGRVYAWIAKQPSTRIPTALDARIFRTGECLEHTVLFTAMARASGIPTRMAAGLAPIRGIFYFHTWPEIWIGQWVPVDPTRGEWPARAARIRFIIGDMKDLVGFAEKISSINVNVLEVL